MPQRMQSIRVGLAKTLQLHVDERLTVPALALAFGGFRDMPPVFATAFMIAFVEWACIEALAGHLGADQRTVGIRIDISHVAATPVGMSVKAEVELVALKGRKLRFKVRCSDETGLVGEGIHDRAIIDQAVFVSRLAAKAGRAGV
jgi:fluoroacetyl-CoA thioesterase